VARHGRSASCAIGTSAAHGARRVRRRLRSVRARLIGRRRPAVPRFGRAACSGGVPPAGRPRVAAQRRRAPPCHTARGVDASADGRAVCAARGRRGSATHATTLSHTACYLAEGITAAQRPRRARVAAAGRAPSRSPPLCAGLGARRRGRGATRSLATARRAVAPRWPDVRRARSIRSRARCRGAATGDPARAEKVGADPFASGSRQQARHQNYLGLALAQASQGPRGADH